MIRLVQNHPTTLIAAMVTNHVLPQGMVYPLTFELDRDNSVFRIIWEGGMYAASLNGKEVFV